MMAPTAEAFAGETDATVIKVNVEETPGVGHQYDVRSLPTFLGLRGGEETGRLVGMQDKTVLEELVNWTRYPVGVENPSPLLNSISVVTRVVRSPATHRGGSP